MAVFRYLFPALCFFSTTFCAQNNENDTCYPEVFMGEATYYDGLAGTSAGNCSLPVASDEFLYCALNNFQYNNSEGCDACIEVTGSKGSVILRVVDRCPECKSGDVDMTEEAFSNIADVIDGRVPISWKFTTCPLQENIQIVFKEGSSQFWTSIQLRQLKHAIATLEYWDNSQNAWVAMERKLYNYFEASNGIASPMRLRATSVLGENLIFEDITLVNDTVIPTNQQFSTPVNCATLSVPEVTLNASDVIVYLDKTHQSIVVNSPISNYWKDKSLSLFSMSGQEVLSKSNLSTSQLQLFDIGSLPKGVYILLITKNNGKWVNSIKIAIG